MPKETIHPTSSEILMNRTISTATHPCELYRATGSREADEALECLNDGVAVDGCAIDVRFLPDLNSFLESDSMKGMSPALRDRFQSNVTGPWKYLSNHYGDAIRDARQMLPSNVVSETLAPLRTPKRAERLKSAIASLRDMACTNAVMHSMKNDKAILYRDYWLGLARNRLLGIEPDHPFSQAARLSESAEYYGYALAACKEDSDCMRGARFQKLADYHEADLADLAFETGRAIFFNNGYIDLTLDAAVDRLVREASGHFAWAISKRIGSFAVQHKFKEACELFEEVIANSDVMGTVTVSTVRDQFKIFKSMYDYAYEQDYQKHIGLLARVKKIEKQFEESPSE